MVFEKLTCASYIQIALETMLLPILKCDVYTKLFKNYFIKLLNEKVIITYL
jgi:hypothetical protein